MKYLLIIITFLTVTAASLSASSVENLDSLFNRLARHDGVKLAEVDYTGGWPKHQQIQMGFVMQRGDGKGMTRGERLALSNPDVKLVDSIVEAINNYGSWGSSENVRTTSDDSRRTVYSVHYDEDSDTLYFLRATYEDEPCIPMDWNVRDHYDADESDIVPLQITIRQPEINWTEAVIRFYDEVKYNFVFYDRIAGKWNRIYNRALKEMSTATNDYERGRVLQRMAAACGDGHTYVMLPNTIEVAGSSPFTTVMLPEGLFINTVESRELLDSGMVRGQKIIAVNGETPEAWAERELLPFVSSSTPQWTIHQMYDDYNFSRTRNGTPMNLTLMNSDGSLTHISHNVNGADWDQALAETRRRHFKVLEGNIGLLSIPDFQTNEVCEFFDSVLPEIMTTDALIIDIRGNGGGNSGFSDYIISHLTDRPVAKAPWTSRNYIPAFASWGMKERTYHAAVDTITPDTADVYTKPIAILTDRGTFSAAEDFCSVLRGANRAVIIGTTTGGSTGNGVRPHLTSMIMANICSKHDIGVDGTEWVGRGIIPDIETEESAESYFDPLCDDVVARAVRYLRRG